MTAVVAPQAPHDSGDRTALLPGSPAGSKTQAQPRCASWLRSKAEETVVMQEVMAGLKWKRELREGRRKRVLVLTLPQKFSREDREAGEGGGNQQSAVHSDTARTRSAGLEQWAP